MPPLFPSCYPETQKGPQAGPDLGWCTVCPTLCPITQKGPPKRTIYEAKRLIFMVSALGFEPRTY